MLSKKLKKLSQAIGISALAMSAVFAVPAQAETVTAVMQAGLRSLDPIITSGYIIRNFGYMVYDTLFSIDSKGEIKPQMVQEWTVSDDGKTYTFTLRDGLKWHDGTAVTAEDCLASLERWSKLDKTGQVMASMLVRAEAVDEKTFEMEFDESTDIVLRAMARPSSVPAFMMPKKLAETPTTETLREAIGSGPFKFIHEEYRPGVQAVFEKFTDYVPREEPADGLAGGKVVNIDRVEWVTMPDSMTAVNAILNGEIDYIEQVPHDLLPLLESSDEVNFVVDPLQGSQTALRLNFLHPPFDNKKIRQAALLALDQQAILDAQIGNMDYASTCSAVFGCTNPNAFDDMDDEVIKPHPEKAKKLLEEAGYDGTPVVLLHPTDLGVVTPVLPILGQSLKQAGFNVDLQAMDWQTLLTRRASMDAPSDGGWNGFVTYTVTSEIGDPLGFQWLAGNGEQAWFGWPDLPELEELRSEYARAGDEETLKELAKKAHDMALDEVVLVPLGEFSVVTATSSDIDNIVPSPVPVFWNLTKN